MTTAEQIINNCKKGLITIIQDDTENYMAFSNHKDYDGNYRTSSWVETIEETKRCIGETDGYSEKEIEEHSEEYNWKIVEVYREEVEPFKAGDKVKILPSIEKTEDWTNKSIYGSDSRRYFIDMIGEIVDVHNSESGLYYNVANNGEPRLYKTFIGHEYLAPLNEAKEETIKIGDHTYSKSEVEKRLQGLKEI
jgi:hypothetical protein